MDEFDLFRRLGLALAIGLLVGLERGWREREEPSGSRTAGIRTFALIGLLGGTWGALVPHAGPWPLGLAALSLTGAFALFQGRENAAEQRFSVTSVVAAMVVFALGAFAVLGNMAAAAAAGVAAMALLAGRENLHDFVNRMTWPELRSAVLLLAMTFLLLPVLPNRAVDPWGGVNPYELWLMTISIAAISFVGYAAVRLLGDGAGLLAATGAGALVSSTAVTLNNARLAAKMKAEGSSLLGSAISLAWLVSLLRMTVIALVLNVTLAEHLVLPVVAAALVLAAAAYYLHRRGRDGKPNPPLVLTNPFELGEVLLFGALLSLVILVAKILSDTLGGAGLFPLAAVTGFTDVDPIALSAARLVGNGSVTAAHAAYAILIAAATNMVTKMAIAIFVGGARFGLPLAAAGVASLTAAGVTVLLLS